MTDIKCTTCKKSITNYVGSTRFKCPKCSNFEIVRCFGCREFAAKYTCGACGFVGPN